MNTKKSNTNSDTNNGRIGKTTTAAEPTRKIFDPWNSASTGHQHAANRLSGSTSWRVSRTMKLGQQFKAGHSGGARLYDTVGAGSKDFRKDGRRENGSWEKGAPGLREQGWQDVRGLLGAKAARLNNPASGTQEKEPADLMMVGQAPGSENSATEDTRTDQSQPKAIFRELTMYINGSTAPLVGDHKLKRLLAEHGARVSIALGRRSVTHVILGRPNSTVSGAVPGAGGGLAASKIQKEIARVGGCGVKYVSADWVLDSISAGKRLPEARYKCLDIVHKGQKSVYGMFSRKESNGDGADYKEVS